MNKLAIFLDVGQNVFVITFATQADKSRVTEGSWLFNKHLFVINQFDGFIQLSMTKFDKTALWVQFHNLLLVGMNGECGEKMGKK